MESRRPATNNESVRTKRQALAFKDFVDTFEQIASDNNNRLLLARQPLFYDPRESRTRRKR